MRAHRDDPDAENNNKPYHLLAFASVAAAPSSETNTFVRSGMMAPECWLRNDGSGMMAPE
jgi:hypothetical protein